MRQEGDIGSMDYDCLLYTSDVRLLQAGHSILDQLEEILIRFRENKFDDLLKTENLAELEKLNDQLEACLLYTSPLSK